ncbi:damage-control phosphatase At2g17340-like [Rutidosis leptorrhynchoides]|uniref:damage-control phosphatase At2g17340-like n=1 Tax=Rutidosis leptorrhynchoides TaxID=125765 RepID=UPI003A9A186F
MESNSDMVPCPLLLTPIESNYKACTIPYRIPSDNPKKATPTEISWINLFYNAIPSFKSVIIFVDNSGADLILGILPFARELLRRGTKVILAANDLPSINDITYPELIEVISKLKDEKGQLMGVDTSNLLIANSGIDLPVIDLTRVSEELAYLANDADLVVLEGMGPGIETNLYAQFKCDSMKIGMVKHPEVAQFLGGRLYDFVLKYNEV